MRLALGMPSSDGMPYDPIVHSPQKTMCEEITRVMEDMDGWRGAISQVRPMSDSLSDSLSDIN